MGNTIVATADYGTVITATGAAKIAACILNGTKLNITHAAVGDGGGAYYMPTAEQTDLKNECWRGEIASYEINEANPNMLDVKFIVPAEVGGFTIREAKIIDADGDTFAICNTPDAQKVAITDGVSFPVTMLMHIIVTDASAVNVIVNSSLDTVSREEMEAAIDSALAGYANGVGDAIIRPITIPASGWVEIGESEEDLGDNKYTIDVALEDASENHFPVLAFAIPSLSIAGNAGVCQTIETLDGFVRFWAEAIPAADLAATILLRSENLVDADIATDDEVDDTVDDVFGEGGSSVVPDGYEVATDAEVGEVLAGVYG